MFRALWERYCAYSWYYPEVKIRLDISRMNFDDKFLSSVQPLVDRALKKMADLEAGAIANPDEGWMVGHYWLRNPELAPTPELRTEISETIQQIKTFAADIHQGRILAPNGKKFTTVLMIGIGGSALGPQFVADALWKPELPMKIISLDNTDPEGMQRIYTRLGEELATTVVIVCSKSGGTVETRNGQIETAAEFKRCGLNFSAQAVAVTCKGSKLDQLAIVESWLKRFPMWDFVGGRFSVSSAVGMLPAALQGINIDDFQKGEREMDIITRTRKGLDNPALAMALMWHYAGEGYGKKDLVILPYKDRLVLFSKYLQQLIMESLGKKLDLDGKEVNQGLTVFGNKGSTDQHAYVQQLRDGLNNFFVTFIEVLAEYNEGTEAKQVVKVEEGITSGDYLDGFMLGTRQALTESSRQSMTITLDELNTMTLGSLIALYERAVGFYAYMINVNSYCQPGVEAGKVAAKGVIETQKSLLKTLSMQTAVNKSLSAMDAAELIDSPDQVETVFKILDRLSQNPGSGVKCEGSRNPKDAKFRYLPS